MTQVAVSLHDVAPQTWPACLHLLRAIETVATLPVTLLVVPDYHGGGLHAFDARYHAALDRRLARGDELALHGWRHRDTQPLCNGVLDTLRRTRLTAMEGEFSALPEAHARALLAAGIAWFEKQSWPLYGFVAPAWLLSAGTWAALHALPFEWTTTHSALHLLPERRAIPTRTFVYSTRTALRRQLSLVRNETLRRMPRASVVRLALHPADAAHPAIVAHVQTVLATLLVQGSAFTKRALARAARGEDGVIRRPAAVR
jgi:predicted deacetylase